MVLPCLCFLFLLLNSLCGETHHCIDWLLWQTNWNQSCNSKNDWCLFFNPGERRHHWVSIKNIYPCKHTQLLTQLESYGGKCMWMAAYRETKWKREWYILVIFWGGSRHAMFFMEPEWWVHKLWCGKMQKTGHTKIKRELCNQGVKNLLCPISYSTNYFLNVEFQGAMCYVVLFDQQFIRSLF